jgi:hypothetical protein
MPAGYAAAGEHDVTTSLPADHHRPTHLILPPVGERHQAATGARRGRSRPLRLPGRGQHVRIDGLHILRAAAPAFISKQNLRTGDLDLVTMEERRRLRAEPNTVDRNIRLIAPEANRSLPIGGSLDDRVPGLDPCTGHHDLRRRIATDHDLTDWQGNTPTADLQIRHL